jgi:hypothetical protein
MALATATPAGAVAWANKATHAARWRHVVWPRSSLQRNKRTEAAGRAPLAAAMATGALTRRAARADTQQASIAPAIQLLPAFGLWVGSVCVKHTAGRIIGEPKTSQQPEAAEPQQAAQRCCSLAAARSGA